jgi:hypothetical protein
LISGLSGLLLDPPFVLAYRCEKNWIVIIIVRLLYIMISSVCINMLMLDMRAHNSDNKLSAQKLIDLLCTKEVIMCDSLHCFAGLIIEISANRRQRNVQEQISMLYTVLRTRAYFGRVCLVDTRNAIFISENLLTSLLLLLILLLLLLLLLWLLSAIFQLVNYHEVYIYIFFNFFKTREENTKLLMPKLLLL